MSLFIVVKVLYFGPYIMLSWCKDDKVVRWWQRKLLEFSLVAVLAFTTVMFLCGSSSFTCYPKLFRFEVNHIKIAIINIYYLTMDWITAWKVPLVGVNPQIFYSINFVPLSSMGRFSVSQHIVLLLWPALLFWFTFTALVSIIFSERALINPLNATCPPPHVGHKSLVTSY